MGIRNAAFARRFGFVASFLNGNDPDFGLGVFTKTGTPDAATGIDVPFILEGLVFEYSHEIDFLDLIMAGGIIIP